MELSSCVISKSVPSYYANSGAACDAQMGKNCGVSRVCFGGGSLIKGRVKLRRDWSGCGFVEKGHVDYYKGSIICGERKEKMKGNKGWGEVSMKKKMKLVKGLVKDLKEFSELGFGLQGGCDQGLVCQDDQARKISEAAEILLAQLKLLKAEEEKQKCKDQDCESSSSESSDSECDDVVVDMKCFRKAAIVQPVENLKEPSLLSLPTPEVPMAMTNQECSNMILETTLNDNAIIEVLDSETTNPNQSNPVNTVSSLMTMSPPMEKRVEVCMGGKCKKMGGPALMEEFQRAVGDDTVVVGCKCMGKCKRAPNVRVVMNGENVNDDSLRTPSNPVLTGVGLEDVELIVANYLGEETVLSVAVPALPC